MLEHYTQQGIDTLCMDLGIITVCSYQQLYLKRPSEKYKYVICDECHFFTGDSLFNPCTEEILSFIIKEYENAIRIYMSATLEDTFIPIIEKEYAQSKSHHIKCMYYYFERNYDYIKKIYAYRELAQLIPKIKEDKKSKWLIFVNSKSKGKKFKEDIKNSQTQYENLGKILSKENVKVTFLTSESKDTETYQNIVENEKFEEQVLISTSVLDNGINIKDRQVKNVVIDMLDKTEFIQMLGRVRINGDMQINLYIRNYSTEEVEKFLIEDVEALIARLSSDFQKEDRNIFFNTYSDPRYKVNELFYITGLKPILDDIKSYVTKDDAEHSYEYDDNFKYSSNMIVSRYKYFDYNHCAIYKLVERISVFMEILKCQDSEYFLPTEKLNKRTPIGTRLYNYYSNESNPENMLLKQHISHILESEKNYKHRIQTKYYHHYFSLRNDFLVRMLEILSETKNLQFQYADYDNDSYKQREEHQESLLSLCDSEVPVLTEQAHWIERVLNHSSDFEYLEEIKEEPKLTELEIEQFLKKYSVKLSDYPNELKKNQQNWSFKDLKILDTKGALVTDFKDDTEDPKIKEYQKVFKFFYEKYKVCKLGDLIKIFEDDAYIIGNKKYQLVKARGTTDKDRNLKYLFIRLIRKR